MTVLVFGHCWWCCCRFIHLYIQSTSLGTACSWVGRLGRGRQLWARQSISACGLSRVSARVLWWVKKKKAACNCNHYHNTHPYYEAISEGELHKNCSSGDLYFSRPQRACVVVSHYACKGAAQWFEGRPKMQWLFPVYNIIRKVGSGISTTTYLKIG